MPTANSTSPRRSKAGTKAARRSAAASSATKAKATRSKATRAKAARSKSTRAKSARAKGARTRASNQTRTAVRNAGPATQWAISDRSNGGVVFGDYAERAVLIPVGAALIVRDRVLSNLNHTISSYSSPSRAQAQLRRFERRGATARNRLEREVRKTRVRVERELRQRRRVIEKTVNELDERRDAVAKNGTELANRVQERILNLV